MKIDDKYINTIITSLEYSIHHVREWHAKEIVRTKGGWDYDYEKNSVKPIQEALDTIKNNIKNHKR